MAVKEWFRRLQPVQLYLVLFFTTAFFIVEIIASHVTHSLTLLLNGYHMLCNIVALIGCIASVKYAHRKNCNGGSRCSDSSICMNGDEKGSAASVPSKPKQSCSDRRMKNTFGWARIDILTMLVCCVLLASFCFSLLVEALQTLVHIDHLDEMHHALPVICIGISGILLNGCCYVIIGGYTFNQGIFLHVTKEGNIILQRNVRSERGAVEGEQKLAPVPNRTSPLALPRRPAYREMLRDVLGCFLVVIASIIVYFTDAHLAKFIDPIFAIISAISLFVLSYPYMRESGLILLQTIPNHINIDSLKKELLAAFPGIVNVHDLHVWHLAGEKVICTAHIIFLDPMVYTSITDQVTDFFVDIGITQVTIQPEFHKMKPNAEKSPCLIRCQGKRCKESQCCSKEGSTTEDHATGHGHLIHKKSAKKELLPAPLVVDPKKFNLNKSDSARSVDEVGCIQNSSRSLSDPRNSRSPKNSIFAIDVEIVEANVNDPVHEDTIIYENLDEHCAAETVQTDR